MLVNMVKPATLTIDQHDATVWSQDQTISGSLDTLLAEQGILVAGDSVYSITFSQEDGSFSRTIHLSQRISEIYAEISIGDHVVQSETVLYTLGYEIRPQIMAVPRVEGRMVYLHGQVIDPADGGELRFKWQPDPVNKATFDLTGIDDSVATFTVGDKVPEGEYYFDLLTISTNDDTVKARTFVTVDSTGVIPFDIETGHAAWIDSAIIYQITPYNFVSRGGFDNVTEKLHEIAALGINTIYLQPVYPNVVGGQGYDITDYFEIRSDYGDAQSLRRLIRTARELNLRVMFDMAIGQTSMYHSYAQHTLHDGEDSHYYDFYKREFDNAPYSMHYNIDPDGFIYYFWPDLPMLNYDHPEVRKWMTEACLYWIREFDIDGYRFDAIWGVNARRPGFGMELRRAIKSLKPEFFMLAEDKAGWPETFEKGYDAAYDWKSSENWVSEWSWQTEFPDDSYNPTIFNTGNENERAAMLRSALTNYGAGYHPDAVILRYMENNDTHRFISWHGPGRVKMVAAMMIALPGVPMLYNGQEIAFSRHPYETFAVFQRQKSIRDLDYNNIWNFYHKILKVRRSFPALTSENFSELSVTPSEPVFAFRRWIGGENLFCIMNMSEDAQQVSVNLPVDDIPADPGTVHYVTDVLSGELWSGLPDSLQRLELAMAGYHTRILAWSDSLLPVDIESEHQRQVPVELSLSRNYPNPFNPRTKFEYTVPEAGHVRIGIFTITGEKVQLLLDGHQNSGTYEIGFDGSHLASGIYIYRLQFGQRSISRKMVLVK